MIVIIMQIIAVTYCILYSLLYAGTLCGIFYLILKHSTFQARKLALRENVLLPNPFRLVKYRIGVPSNPKSMVPLGDGVSRSHGPWSQETWLASWLYHLLVVWPWVSWWPSVSLDFFIYTIRFIWFLVHSIVERVNICQVLRTVPDPQQGLNKCSSLSLF